MTVTAPDLSPAEAEIVARFESAPTPPEVVEARVVEEVAQAIRDSNGTPEALAAWRRHPQLIPAHVYAAAAVAGYRAAQDGGAEEAVFCGRMGQTCTGICPECRPDLRAALAPQAGDGAR